MGKNRERKGRGGRREKEWRKCRLDFVFLWMVEYR